eukprot:6723492-Alexandrium_andersonii.AAC.1
MSSVGPRPQSPPCPTDLRKLGGALRSTAGVVGVQGGRSGRRPAACAEHLPAGGGMQGASSALR